MALATLSIDLVANTAALEKTLGRVADWGKNVGSALAVGFGAATAAATAVITTVDALAKKAGDFQDLAEQTGATAEGLASMAVSAAVGGASMEEVGAFAVKLTKNLTGVDDESKAAGAAIAALGLDIEAFKKADPTEQLEQIAKALAGFGDGAEKTAVMEALAKGGAKLLPFLKELGAEGGRQVILTQAMIEQADAYADRQAKVRAELDLYAQALATQALPAVSAFTGAMTDTLKEVLGLDKGASALAANDGVQTFATSAVRVLGFVVDAADGVYRSVALVGKSFGAIGAAVVAVAQGDFAQLPAIQAALKEDADAILSRGLFSDKLAARLAAIGKEVAGGVVAGAEAAAEVPKKKLSFTGAAKSEKTAKDKKDPLTDAQTALAAYVKQLDGAIAKEQDLSEVEKARAFLTAHGVLAQNAQVRELLEGLAATVDANKAAAEAERLRVEAVQGASRLAQELVASRAQELDAMADSNQALRDEIALIGLDEKARTALILARQDQAIADKELDLIQAQNIEGNEVAIQQLEREIALLRQKRVLTADKAKADETADAAKKIADNEKAVSTSLERSISDGILSGFRNGGNLATVFLDELKAQFGKTVLQPIIKPIAEFGSQLITSGLSSLVKALGFADGGVMTPAGAVPLPASTPVRAYAEGGIARRPQLAVYGEGRMPEAYIPLPDGHTVPVHVSIGSDGAPLARVPLPGGRSIPATLDMPREAFAAQRVPDRADARDGLRRVAAFAQGGVMTARGEIDPARLPVHAYARGGVATQPQLAVFGEGRMPEAYVPLPDGKTVPVHVSIGSDGAPLARVPLPGGRSIPATLDMPREAFAAQRVPDRADARDGLRRVAAFARGGVMTARGEVPAARLPVRAYAKGGVASSPQVAIYGEGSTPEAFVPLPDGRRIPVDLAGGESRAPVVIHIHNTIGSVASQADVVAGMRTVRAQIVSEFSRSTRLS